MQWDLKKSAGLFALTAVIATSVAVDAADRRGRKGTSPKPVMTDSRGLEPGPVAAAPVTDGPDSALVPQSVVIYDEVGYASWYGDERAGQPTANGEAFNPAGFTAAHPTLPIPTYVEVTHLDTGKTILVRVNDRGPSARGRLIDLSAAAARDLGIGGSGTAPVRVRRVNPPDQEKAALMAGQKAGDRLNTPPQLLTALRKKLGAGPISPALDRQAALPPSQRPAPVADAPVYRPSETSDDGFIVEEAGARPARVVVSKPQRAPTKTRAASNSGASFEVHAASNDGFVIEQADNQRQAIRTARSEGSYYVQVAAFSDENRARATAGKVGAGIERAGNIYRVRKGPYPSEASARAALGPIAAKGYRDARVTR